PAPGLDFFERAANPEDFFASTREKPAPADDPSIVPPPPGVTAGGANQADSGFDPAPTTKQRPRESFEHVPASLRPAAESTSSEEEEAEEEEETKAEAKLAISKKLSAIARKPESTKKKAVPAKSLDDDDDDDDEGEGSEEAEEEVDTIRSDEELQPI